MKSEKSRQRAIQKLNTAIEKRFGDTTLPQSWEKESNNGICHLCGKGVMVSLEMHFSTFRKWGYAYEVLGCTNCNQRVIVKYLVPLDQLILFFGNGNYRFG